MSSARGACSLLVLLTLSPIAAAGDGNRFCQGNSFGAGADTVLGVAAVADPSFAHQAVKTFILFHSAGRVHVEEASLSNGGGTDKVRFGIDLGTSL